MSGNALLLLRAVHILCAALWLGAGTVLALLVMPALRQSGPEGVRQVVRLEQRGLSVFMASVAGITVLSGLLLYWTFSDGLDGQRITTSVGIAYTTGGIAGLLAAIIGGSMIGRSMHRIAALAERGPAPEIDALFRRAHGAGRIALALMLVALLSMALAPLF